MESVPYHRLAQQRRWRALVEILLTIVFGFLGMIVLVSLTFAIAGVMKLDDLDEPSRLVVNLGGLALLVPACLLAGRALDRPRGTLSSTAGRLRWSWLVRCVVLALIVEVVLFGGPIALSVVAGGEKLTWAGWDRFLPLAVAIVGLVPLQASGEEYLFRGSLVQALGAWVRSPWLPILLSAVAFSAIHKAPLEASVSVFMLGVVAGYLTIRTGGLEAAIASHVINNVAVLLFNAASGASTSAVQINGHASWLGVVIQLATQLVYAALVLRSFRRRPPG